MPTLKTHKGSKWRVRVSATGKLLHGRTGRRHLLTGKSGRTMRQLRRPSRVAKVNAKIFRRLLPYG